MSEEFLAMSIFNLGPGELALIFLIVLLLFGGSKLPEVARSMGKAMRAFREESQALKRELEEAANPPESKPELKPTPPSSSAKPGETPSQETKTIDVKPEATIESQKSKS